MVRGLTHVVVSSAAILLAACSTTQNQGRVTADPNISPLNYRADIQAFLRNYLNNPSQIRGAFVSEPALMQVGGVQRYASCLRFNARKSDGQYEGSKDRLVLFLSGRLDTMVPAKPEHCASAAYQPFPELERLSR
jgi:hypothetical protein